MKKECNIQLASAKQCTGCEACVSVCPTNSITMKEDIEGFLQPHIDKDTCIGCHKCEKTCPIVTPITISTDFGTKAYAAINKDEAVRMRSSSGGMFHALAKWTIEQGGVVFGARFNENWEVVHDFTETIDGIEPFMRSKYVQSRIGDTFKQAEAFLKEGRQVLFVGTPCQIGGLKAYLHKEYDKLLAVDFICHGVPSPGVWNIYIQEYFKNDELISFNFRDKSEGWISYQCIIESKTKSKTERKKLLQNDYFRGFRKEVYLRQSCYECNFRTYHRISDFTIADFWGVDQKCPSMYDNKGTSIVFIHTQQAQGVFQNLSDGLQTKMQSRKDATWGNPGMDSEHPERSIISRKLFYAAYHLVSFRCAMRVVDVFCSVKETCVKYIGKFKRKINKILR
ncbi:MAG: Coenzyme F420 hydrogenase/dehydrogenase, beta subunit C-terminal domain [Bacteroidales bacterium]|nr:Coenzyme F420 hydrogenase/dehydrogenase, beta subunit C-terminal domain [Bacteroidales bacterium]